MSPARPILLRLQRKCNPRDVPILDRHESARGLVMLRQYLQLVDPGIRAVQIAHSERHVRRPPANFAAVPQLEVMQEDIRNIAYDVVRALVAELFSGRRSVYGPVSGFDFGGGTFGRAGFSLGISIRHQGWPSAHECGRGIAAGRSKDDGDPVHRGVWRPSGAGSSGGEFAGSGSESWPAKRHAESAQLLLECGCGGVPVSGGGGGEEPSDSALPGGGGGVRASGGDWDRSHARLHCRTICEEGRWSEQGCGHSMEARRRAYPGRAVFSLCRHRERFRGMGCFVCEEPGKSDAGPGAHDSFVLLRRAHAGEMAGAAAIANDRRNSTSAGGFAGRLRGYGGPGFVARPAWGGGECWRRGTGPLLRLSHYDLAIVPGIWASVVADWVFHVHEVKHRRRAASLVGRRFVESFRYPQGRTGRATDRMRGHVWSIPERVEGGAGRSRILGPGRRSDCDRE